MTVHSINIASRDQWLKLRSANIGASEIAALFGESQFKTAYQLWGEKTGQIAATGPSTKLMKRGLIFEKSVAEAISLEEPGWTIVKANDYLLDDERRLGATPDFYVTSADRPNAIGVMQTKFIAGPEFKKHWIEEPPFGVVLQTTQEVMLKARSLPGVEVYGIIAAIGIEAFDHSLDWWIFDRDLEAEARIEETSAAFWDAVARGEAPSIDYARDGDALREIYAEANGAEIDLTGDNRLPEIAPIHKELSALKNQAEAQLKKLNAEILAKLGSATSATYSGGRIKAPTIPVKASQRDAYTYRRITITPDQAQEATAKAAKRRKAA